VKRGNSLPRRRAVHNVPGKRTAGHGRVRGRRGWRPARGRRPADLQTRVSAARLHIASIGNGARIAVLQANRGMPAWITRPTIEEVYLVGAFVQAHLELCRL